MQRFLHAGERYALGWVSRQQLYVLGIMFFSFINGSAIAQKVASDMVIKQRMVPQHLQYITPLKVGDAIPEELWNSTFRVINHPEGLESVQLSAWKGKRLILDFWSTWCTVCIIGFERVDFLKNYFEGEVDFLLVNSSGNGDYKDDLQVFLKNRKSLYTNGFKIPSIVEEDRLRIYFPHRSIPYYVWIDEHGKLAKVSGPAEIDLFSIRDFFKNQERRRKLGIIN